MTEGTFEVVPGTKEKQGGLSLQVMDSSHVSLVYVRINESRFTTFKYTAPGRRHFGLNFNYLAKMLRCVRDDDDVMEVTWDGGQTMQFVFRSEILPYARRWMFDIRVLNLEPEMLGIPDTEHSYQISMPSQSFRDVCRDLLMFGESVEVDVSRDSVNFMVLCDAGQASVFYRESNDVLIVKYNDDWSDSDEGDTLSMSFALRYLHAFTKAAPLADWVTLKLSQDLPIVVQYEIDAISMEYFLAPKIEDDSE